MRSHVAMKGAVPALVERYAGHRSIKTTERYTHLSGQILTDSNASLAPEMETFSDEVRLTVKVQ